jgi:hypothetical protein
VKLSKSSDPHGVALCFVAEIAIIATICARLSRAIGCSFLPCQRRNSTQLPKNAKVTLKKLSGNVAPRAL